MAENKNQAVNEEVTTTTDAAMIDENEYIADDSLPIFVECEKNRSANGRVYNNYFVRGERFGREFRSFLKPRDNGGYAVLEDIFSTAKDGKIHLDIGRAVRAGADNKLIRYNSYSVKACDEYGAEFVQNLIPDGDTSKSNLESIIRQVRAKLDAAANASTDKQEEKKVK